MARKRQNQADAERSGREVAAAVLARLPERPRDDDPKSQIEYDALSAAAAGNLGRRLALIPLTDLGNAERFAERYQGKLLHVAAIGWLAWDGRRWNRERADIAVSKAVHNTARAIQEEADAIRDTSDDFEIEKGKAGEAVMFSDKLAKWGRSSESATRLQAISKYGAPYLSAEASELDSDPWCLNVLNGTLRINRHASECDPIAMHPHRPEDRITKLAPINHDPEARAPMYARFLSQVQPDAAMQRFLHQWGGYSLTGDTGEQKLCFFYGKGRNGKSTLIDAWSAVAGDYGETVPIETFLDQGRGRNAGSATPDLALLPGVHFLRTSEPEKGAKLAESLIKLVTGGEPIQARHLNRDYFKFRPAFKLTMSGNYRPSISGTDEGIWRRVVLVPWSLTVEKPDPTMAQQLAGEASGILNRLLDGLRDYIDQGLALPGEVSEATANYREDSDPLGRFLKVCVEPSIGNRVQSSDMHRLYIAWARAVGESEWTPKGFARGMKERGFRSKNSHVMWWLDCRLTASDADFVAPAPPAKEAGDG